jgi:hypothetical protein
MIPTDDRYNGYGQQAQYQKQPSMGYGQ